MASAEVEYVADTPAIVTELERLIDVAERQVILQMYLFAADGQLEVLLPRPEVPPHAERVARRLIEKKRRQPEVDVVVILDSNTPDDPACTRSRELPLRRVLEQSGVPVLNANLFRNTFDGARRRSRDGDFHLDWTKCPPRSWVKRQNRWQQRHNLEDHRKNLVIDGGRAGLVTSHNLIDLAGDWYENAFLLSGEAGRALWAIATQALGHALELPHELSFETRRALEALARAGAAELAGSGGVCLLDARSIRDELVTTFRRAGPDDTLCVATAYFSDAGLLLDLIEAAKRGARVQVLIDDVTGLPLPAHLSWALCGLVNHPVTRRARRIGAERPGFELRVHHSRGGPMMHLKTCALFGTGSVLIGGQANFTPNSFSGAWLETDLITRDEAVLAAFRRHFEALWALPESRPLGAATPARAALDAACDAGLWVFERFGLKP